MSRVAKKPVPLPNGVEAQIQKESLTLKGPKGTSSIPVPLAVSVVQEGKALQFAADSERGWAMAGTVRALTNNLVTGVTKGFEKKLELVGVGYRAQSQGRKLNLALGFSHPIEFIVPEGVTVETPSQTEIVIRGVNRQAVGQAAAKIRNFRPPEPYKGKGVKYAKEQLVRKEAKKK